MLPNKSQTNEKDNVPQTTLQSHCECAFWFWPAFTLKTTTESKKSEIIH